MQLALTELKLVGALVLNQQQFWAVFGTCDGNALRKHYPDIRPVRRLSFVLIVSSSDYHNSI